ncbi:MAG: glycosyltransferase [Terrimicrobiaceae bacterium]
MVRVLHVIDHLGLGGAQSALLDLVRNADPGSVLNEVAVLHGKGPFFEALRQCGVPVHSLSARRWPPDYLIELPRLLAGARFDILHFHLQGSNWLAKPLAALCSDRPRVAHDHTSGDLKFRGWHSLLPDALSHLWSDRVIAVSPGVKEFLCCWEAVDPGRVDVVRNGIDTSFFQPVSAERRKAAREHFSICETEVVVGAIGRLSPEKNFAALASVAAAFPDVRLLIAGEGPLEGALREAFRPFGSRVRLCGRVDDREGFYAALDVFTLPSLYEGLPMSLLEAMASGLAPVASRLPDIARAIRDGEEGLLVQPGSHRDLVEAVGLLIGDPARRAEMGQAARARCELDFSACRMAGQVGEVYRSLIEKSRSI